MSHPVKGIDHCFVLTDDLDAAAQQYTALGFTLSPRGLHSKSKGSANYTIIFPTDYLELLGLLHPTEANAHRVRALEQMGQGLHAIACRVDDAGAAATALGEMGIPTQGLADFGRPVPLPDGSTERAEFSTVQFEPKDVPHGAVFMCQHKTPEYVWLPELMRHPNGACGLDAVMTISADPASEAAGFARLWAEGKVVAKGECFTVETGVNSAPLLVVSKEEAGRLYPGLDLDETPTGAFAGIRIKTGDMEQTRACLSGAGIACVETARGVAVSPCDAAGAIVEFVP